MLVAVSTYGIRGGEELWAKKSWLMGIASICSGLESFPDLIRHGEEGEV